MDFTPHDLDLDRRRAEVLERLGSSLPQHLVSPGHFPGQLYDCPACEVTCYCTSDSTECVYCAQLNSTVSIHQLEGLA